MAPPSRTPFQHAAPDEHEGRTRKPGGRLPKVPRLVPPVLRPSVPPSRLTEAEEQAQRDRDPHWTDIFYAFISPASTAALHHKRALLPRWVMLVACLLQAATAWLIGASWVPGVALDSWAMAAADKEKRDVLEALRTMAAAEAMAAGKPIPEVALSGELEERLLERSLGYQYMASRVAGEHWRWLSRPLFWAGIVCFLAAYGLALAITFVAWAATRAAREPQEAVDEGRGRQLPTDPLLARVAPPGSHLEKAGPLDPYAQWVDPLSIPLAPSAVVCLYGQLPRVVPLMILCELLPVMILVSQVGATIWGRQLISEFLVVEKLVGGQNASPLSVEDWAGKAGGWSGLFWMSVAYGLVELIFMFIPYILWKVALQRAKAVSPAVHSA